MVIATSDSTNTLVSLDHQSDAAKHEGRNHLIVVDGAFCSNEQPQLEYVRTEILVPADDECHEMSWMEDGDSDTDDDGSQAFATAASSQPQQLPQLRFVPLYLPTRGRSDAVLNRIPQLVERCDELLAVPPRHFTRVSGESILYIAQGERGSATSRQCDVILSDRATTCHILAFRSTCGNRNTAPLTSLTHLDGTAYDTCIRSMLDEHVQHHRPHTASVHEEEKKSEDEPAVEVENSKISIEMHIVGGFNDDDSASCTITDWLMPLLARLSFEYSSHKVEMILKTCAVSCMNDSGHAGPIGRGLGIDTRTGEAFLAKCDESVAGPCIVLRSVRIWSGPKTLSCIHNSKSKNRLCIRPFQFRPFSDIPSLLRLTDDVLLQYTSTSPDAEEAGFCDSVRKSLSFLQSQDCRRIFGWNLDQPLVYERTNRTTTNTNASWRRVA